MIKEKKLQIHSTFKFKHMRKNNLMIALAITTSVLLGACGTKETKENTPEATLAEPVINTTHAYICPMNCENSASNEPGQCKVCGMDLVKNPNFAGTMYTTSMETDTTGAGIDQSGTKTDGHNHENHEGHNH